MSELQTRVFESLGTASVCWDDDGIFEGYRAKQVGDELVSWIEENYELKEKSNGE